MALWVIRILFLGLCTTGGFAVSQVRSEWVGYSHSGLLGMVIGFGFGWLMIAVESAGLCILSGIGIGTFIATFTKSAQQSMMSAFFINSPLSVLSRICSPFVEAMPSWLQPVTWLNPIRHFGIISRATLMKGGGIDVLWPNFLALIGFTVILQVSLSIWRFRKQLG